MSGSPQPFQTDIGGISEEYLRSAASLTSCRTKVFATLPSCGNTCLNSIFLTTGTATRSFGAYPHRVGGRGAAPRQPPHRCRPGEDAAVKCCFPHERSAAAADSLVAFLQLRMKPVQTVQAAEPVASGDMRPAPALRRNAAAVGTPAHWPYQHNTHHCSTQALTTTFVGSAAALRLSRLCKPNNPWSGPRLQAYPFSGRSYSCLAVTLASVARGTMAGL